MTIDSPQVPSDSAGAAPVPANMATQLIHHPYVPPAGFEAPQVPVHKAATVIFPNVAAMRSRQWKDKSGYTYGLHGTPTTFTLEERLCTLEGARFCLLAPSGLAAIALVNYGLLKTGDEVLLPDNVYGPSKSLAQAELQRMGISCGLFDPMIPQSLGQRIKPSTKLVWLEAPGSVSMEFPDLVEQIRICREKGVMVALDNTWGAGLAFAPLDVIGDGTCGVDVSIHALTKYPSGGGDVLMGSVAIRDAAIHAALQRTHMHWGLGVGVNDVEAVLRGLPSMAVRYQAQDHSARVLAAWLGQQKGVVQVLHPALEGAPGHAQWKQVCTSSAAPQGLAAGIFTVVLDANYQPEQVDVFCDALRLFRLGYSWGGPVSLVVPYAPDTMRSLPAPHIKPGYWVRFAIGLEATCDLQEDLRQAMWAAFSNR